MNSLFSGRTTPAIGLLLGIAAMAFAIGYLQLVEGLAPCNLCILDRAVVIGLCVVFVVALIHNPFQTGRRIYAALAILLSLTGIGICLRHLWLQSLPKDTAPDCGAGFWYMLDTMPLQRFFDTIFNSTGDCADIQWQLLGLSIPALTLILFVDFFFLALIMFFTKGRRVRHNPELHR